VAFAMSVTTYRAHILTPVSAASPTNGAGAWRDWVDGRLDVESGKIRSVGPWRRTPRYTDLRPHLMLPGLVDVHAHVPQLPVCGVHPDNLLDWLQKWTFPLESRFRGARARTLSAGFVREMLGHGTTTAALYTSAWPDSVTACFEAARAARIHAWIGPPLMDDDDAYRSVTTAQVLDEARQLARLDSPSLRFAVTPRFALSCSPDLLRGAAHLAREFNLPVQTHLAEQREECREVRRRFGRRYLDVYDRAGLLGPRSLFAHAIWLTDRDWQRLSVAAVAHCPTSNLFLGSGVMDWWRARSARVGLGSDVGAGPDLSIFRVARTAWIVHSMAGSAPSAAELLRAATLGGAHALGFHDVGSLEAGKCADVVLLDAARVIPPGAPDVESTDDLLSRILHRAGRSSIRQVYVSGRVMVDNSRGES